MKIYISGPMTGQPERESPAFDAAAVALEGAGHQPINRNPGRRLRRHGVELRFITLTP